MEHLSRSYASSTWTTPAATMTAPTMERSATSGPSGPRTTSTCKVGGKEREEEEEEKDGEDTGNVKNFLSMRNKKTKTMMME